MGASTGSKIFSVKMTLNLFRLKAICDDKDAMIHSLKEWKLIPVEGEYACPTCGGLLHLVSDSSR